MKYFKIEPEVAGGFGARTVLSTECFPPKVHQLHYEFDGWQGDAILATFPCYIISYEAKTRLEARNLTGADFDNVEISVSEQFKELYPQTKLPNFFWLKITGSPGVDDFGIGTDHMLVISERVRTELEGLGIAHAEIVEL
jgi:hypothetical protein